MSLLRRVPNFLSSSYSSSPLSASASCSDCYASVLPRLFRSSASSDLPFHPCSLLPLSDYPSVSSSRLHDFLLSLSTFFSASDPFFSCLNFVSHEPSASPLPAPVHSVDFHDFSHFSSILNDYLTLPEIRDFFTVRSPALTPLSLSAALNMSEALFRLSILTWSLNCQRQSQRVKLEDSFDFHLIDFSESSNETAQQSFNKELRLMNESVALLNQWRSGLMSELEVHSSLDSIALFGFSTLSEYSLFTAQVNKFYIQAHEIRVLFQLFLISHPLVDHSLTCGSFIHWLRLFGIDRALEYSFSRLAKFLKNAEKETIEKLTERGINKVKEAAIEAENIEMSENDEISLLNICLFRFKRFRLFVQNFQTKVNLSDRLVWCSPVPDDQLRRCCNERVLQLQDSDQADELLECKEREEIPNEFQQCSRCKLVVYCSRQCQAEHWKLGNHKFTCNRKE
jgi:hypothetical protein